MPRGKKKKKVIEISPPTVRGRKRRGHANSHSPVRSPITPSSLESIHCEEAEMAEQNNLNLSDYATSKLDGLQHSIWRSSIIANNFEIKPATIQLLQANVRFGGSIIEDPKNHILNFLEICDTFKHNGVSNDAIRLRPFPFSLRDKAKFWLQSLLEGSITTWEVGTSIKAVAGGALMSKPVDDAYTLLETMSSNKHQWHSDINVHARVAGIQDSYMFSSLSFQSATLAKNANNPYSNTYNPSWRNHPNFSWNHNQGVGPSLSSARPNNPLGFNVGGFNQQARMPPSPVEKKPSLEEKMKSYMSKIDALMQS
ncbi:uncharacterized protein G2W53_041201 [Senna tora]|uniref:Uncharacterized protein n=1 Tax=Senna tora TaxID=362788 RepID=A0A834SDC5_9FABA|nr:uncharacterized protein G2W53_041201 [Senna tora]